MESFRDSLITKIDSIISNLDDTQASGESQLQIEATVIPRHRTRTSTHRTFVLGTLDVGQWQTASPGRTPRSTSPFRSQPTSTSPGLQTEILRPAGSSADDDHHSAVGSNANEGRPRRKAVGGLRLGGNTPQRTPSPEGTRQLQTDHRSFPKRRKVDDGPAKLQPSTVDKLIEGIWEQIHTPNILIVPPDVSYDT